MNSEKNVPLLSPFWCDEQRWLDSVKFSDNFRALFRYDFAVEIAVTTF